MFYQLVNNFNNSSINNFTAHNLSNDSRTYHISVIDANIRNANNNDMSFKFYFNSQRLHSNSKFGGRKNLYSNNIICVYNQKFKS